ncbi:ATP-binding protein [Edaphobacter sp. HDX4]|uniref:ATP-binding protein n=1 Tax=Edaphobacter sp. HDX4 TaxID=2794064 RepID=UPI002FE61169
MLVPVSLAQTEAHPSGPYLAEKSRSGALPGLSSWRSDSLPHIEVADGSHEIVILFDKDGLSEPASTEVRYRLVGYDSEWKNTRLRAAHYSQLTPGSYRFEVQERKEGSGEWLSHAMDLSIGEKPEIYESWYFYLVLLLLAIVLPAYLYRRRVQMMKGHIGIVLEERNRIARECHDTLMAGFAAISWQLEATAKLFSDSDLTATPAAKSCELARSMVSHCQAEARRIIWDLRDSDEMTNVLSQALARTLTANHLRGSISTVLDVDGDEPPLPPGCVHHLVCIGQEAITNAIRHANPTNIVVRLKYDSDALNLSIQDDGRGFQSSGLTASRRGHFGIPVMEERTRKLGGTFRLQSTVGGGTEVSIWVPFNAMQLPINQEHHVIRWIGI